MTKIVSLLKTILIVVTLFAYSSCKHPIDYLRLADDYYEKEEYELAIENYTKVIEKNPGSNGAVEAFFNKGQSYLMLGDYLNAISNFSNFIEYINDNHIAYYKRGLAYQYNEQFSYAIEDYCKCIDLAPEAHAHYFFDRGYCYYYLELYTAAKENFDICIIKHPTNSEAYDFRARSKYFLGNYNEAIIDYNKSIELEPGDFLKFYNRGIAKNKITDLDGAIRDYTKAIQMNPDYVNAYRNRAVVKGKLEKYLEAIQDCNKALEMNPSYWQVYSSRAGFKYKLSDLRGAHNDINRAIQLNPDIYPEDLFTRGIIRIYMNMKDEGCEDLSKAGELGLSKAYAAIKELCR